MTGTANATFRCLRAWLRPGPEDSIFEARTVLSVAERSRRKRSEFRSPKKRDWGTGTRRATPGRQWFWVLLPKQKSLS